MVFSALHLVGEWKSILASGQPGQKNMRSTFVHPRLCENSVVQLGISEVGMAGQRERPVMVMRGITTTEVGFSHPNVMTVAFR